MNIRTLCVCTFLTAAMLAAPGYAQTTDNTLTGVGLGKAVETEASAFETLPLHLPTVGPSRAKIAAIFMTGDGGWAPFDQNVSADLSNAGVPTTGFDTGTYFSTMRTPDEAAAALAESIKAVMEHFDSERIMLVGYSFGADVGPFILNRLPPHLRERVDRLALMSPSEQAPFQVTLLERAGLAIPGARPVLPELTSAANAGHRIVCLYGQHDKDAICPKADLPSMKVVKLKGGHGFDDDHMAVANAILSAWQMPN